MTTLFGNCDALTSYPSSFWPKTTDGKLPNKTRLSFLFFFNVIQEKFLSPKLFVVVHMTFSKEVISVLVKFFPNYLLPSRSLTNKKEEVVSTKNSSYQVWWSQISYWWLMFEIMNLKKNRTSPKPPRKFSISILPVSFAQFVLYSLYLAFLLI